MNNYYVYIYLDPRKCGIFRYENFIFDNEPFYIGKGTKNRHLKHLHYSSRDKNLLKINKIKKIKQLNIEPIIVIYKNELSEYDAYTLESEMIKTIGRLDIKTGPLTNLIDGGYCGTRNTSTEIRYSYGSGTRGKSYEEIYGYENAKVLKNKRAESNRNRDIRKKIDTSYIKGMYEINLGVTNHTVKKILNKVTPCPVFLLVSTNQCDCPQA